MNINRWFTSVTPNQRKLIAKLCGFSTSYLYAVFDGTRELSPRLAMLLEKHTREVNKEDPTIPIIKQGESCKICSQCPYYKSCK